MSPCKQEPNVAQNTRAPQRMSPKVTLLPVWMGILVILGASSAAGEVVGAYGGGACDAQQFGDLQCNPLPANYYSGGNCVTGAPLLPKSPCVDTTGAGKCVQGRCDCTAYEEKYVCQRCNVLSQMEADGTHSGYRILYSNTSQQVDLCSVEWGGGACSTDSDCAALNGGLCINGQCICSPGFGCPYCDRTELDLNWGLGCLSRAQASDITSYGHTGGMPCCSSSDCNNHGQCIAVVGAKFKTCVCGVGFSCSDCRTNISAAITGSYQCNKNLKPQKCAAPTPATPASVTAASPSAAKDSSSGTLPAWIIGTIIAGVVAFIVILMVLVYFIFYRPRHSGYAGNPTDEEEDDRYI